MLMRSTFLLAAAALFAAPVIFAGPDQTESPAAATSHASISSITGDTLLKSARGKDFTVISVTVPGSHPQHQTSSAYVRTTKAGPAGHRFLIQGGLHGNEQQTTHFVTWLARRIASGQGPLAALPGGTVIDFIPEANPDGVASDSRYNARGVNLNRNFDVLWGLTRENPGFASFSEPETKALRGLFANRSYTAAIDVHGYINWIVAPSTPSELKEQGFNPSREKSAIYEAWIRATREEMRSMPGYQLKTGAKLGDGGAFEDWAFWSEGTLSLCLEMETFQRFVKSHRMDFSDLSQPRPVTIDLYTRYEAFIARMFVQAIRINPVPGSAEKSVAKQ